MRRHLVLPLALAMLLPALASAADFRNSYALVIGVNDYSRAPGWADLAYAERDADHVGAYFRSQGYKVRVMKGDGTRRNIAAYLLDELAPRLGADDRVVFYFGGHGHSQEIDGRQIGYILPAGVENSADYISMGDLRTWAERLGRARHLLFVINACYGGILGGTRGGGIDPSQPDYIQEITRRPARQFIAAGGADQQVLDGGPGKLSWFTYYFLEALQEGAANTHRDRLITFSELNGYLVPRASNAVQTPAWGALDGHGQGEFVFSTDVPSSLRRLALPLPPRDTARGTRRQSPAAHTEAPTTRSPDLEAVGRAIDAMKAPIENVFTAWEKLDLELYMAQWAPDALQYSPRFRRNRADILKRRTRDFKRFKSVEVLGYEVAFAGYRDQVAHFKVKYSLRFVLTSGRIFNEFKIGERYETRYSPAAKRWQITVNEDYISRRK